LENFDLTYLTTDSIAEGVGSSQIVPLILNLAKNGLYINLVSYEKSMPSLDYEALFHENGVCWKPQVFHSRHTLGPLRRLNEIRHLVQNSSIIHARSDIPASAAILSDKGPVLWDIRSLWSDQRLFIESSPIKRQAIRASKSLEHFNAKGATAISTLTKSVVPILEKRHKRLTSLRTVVSTFVDLEKFTFVPEMPKRTTALFSGTYNSYYDLKLSREFIESFRKLEAIEVKWARPFETAVQQLDVGEAKVIKVAHNDMNKIVSDSSFGVSVCRNDAGLSLTAASPTKIAEFLAVGRPVVVNSGLGDFDQLLKTYRAGVILDGSPQNTSSQARVMTEILRDPETPERCRRLAEEHFNLEIGTRDYLKVYKEMN
jgi:glycosyltransferase involved in cell wall biosynthesis